MIQVIGVGDNTVDRYLDLEMTYPGGNAVNVAVLAHRYGHPASYMGWLGDDAHGRLILNALCSEGIDTSRCRVVHGPNACSDVSLVDGDRVFGTFDPGVCAQIALSDEDLRTVSQHDVTHTSIDVPEFGGSLDFDVGHSLRYIGMGWAGWGHDYTGEV